MTKERKFFQCSICGNLVGLIHEGGGELVCCGKPMNLLKPNTSDGAGEKHLPEVSFVDENLTVQIGSVLHPSTPEHHIEWIYVVTKRGGQRYTFKPDEEPRVEFCFCGQEEPLAVYAYCNLHGLWLA